MAFRAASRPTCRRSTGRCRAVSRPISRLASAQAVFYLILIFVLLGWYLWATRQEGKYALVSARGASADKLDVGGWKYLSSSGSSFCTGCFAFVGLVLIALLISIMPYYTVTEGNPFHSFTPEHYLGLIKDGVARSVINSLILAAVVAVVTVVCAFILSMVSLKTKWRGRRAVRPHRHAADRLPPLVFSVALLITLVSVPGLSSLYNGRIPMIAAVGGGVPAVRRAHDLELADRVAQCAYRGVARLRRRPAPHTMRSITIPILGPAIASASLLVFMYSLRELAAVALLVRPGLSLIADADFRLPADRPVPARQRA